MLHHIIPVLGEVTLLHVLLGRVLGEVTLLHACRRVDVLLVLSAHTGLTTLLLNYKKGG